MKRAATTPTWTEMGILYFASPVSINWPSLSRMLSCDDVITSWQERRPSAFHFILVETNPHRK